MKEVLKQLGIIVVFLLFVTPLGMIVLGAIGEQVSIP